MGKIYQASILVMNAWGQNLSQAAKRQMHSSHAK